MSPAAGADVSRRRARGQFVSPRAADSCLFDAIGAVPARRDLAESRTTTCSSAAVA